MEGQGLPSRGLPGLWGRRREQLAPRGTHGPQGARHGGHICTAPRGFPRRSRAGPLSLAPPQGSHNACVDGVPVSPRLAPRFSPSRFPLGPTPGSFRTSRLRGRRVSLPPGRPPAGASRPGPRPWLRDASRFFIAVFCLFVEISFRWCVVSRRHSVGLSSLPVHQHAIERHWECSVWRFTYFRCFKVSFWRCDLFLPLGRSSLFLCTLLTVCWDGSLGRTTAWPVFTIGRQDLRQSTWPESPQDPRDSSGEPRPPGSCAAPPG